MTLTTSIDSLVEASFQSTNNISAEQLMASLVTETNKSSDKAARSNDDEDEEQRNKTFVLNKKDQKK